jgi:hypothetical protein
MEKSQKFPMLGHVLALAQVFQQVVIVIVAKIRGAAKALVSALFFADLFQYRFAPFPMPDILKSLPVD